MKEKERQEEKHPVPFYNLPEELQEELEETYGLNYVDHLKSLNKWDLDFAIHVHNGGSWN